MFLGLPLFLSEVASSFVAARQISFVIVFAQRSRVQGKMILRDSIFQLPFLGATHLNSSATVTLREPQEKTSFILRLSSKELVAAEISMGMYKYITQAWNDREKNDLQQHMRHVAIKWRREPTVQRIDHPTRSDRARALGYKAKQGYVVVRVRIRKGGARKPRPRSGRRQKALGVTRYTRAISLKNIAEMRAKKRFPNLRVLNSYYVWEDGTHRWFETIMRDPHNPVSTEG